MSQTLTSATNGQDAAAMPDRSRLSFDLDVDIAVVGAGGGGLSVGLEAARVGARVAVLEGRQIGLNPSGQHLGTWMPGYALPVRQLIARVGFQETPELAALARRAGARIFEDTPVVSVDPSGIRKRIVTPSARLRASHIVLAGNVHLGATLRRLSETLLPVWRYAAVTAPLGERLTEAIIFKGSVTDTDGIDHFRIVDGDRLMWAGPETAWAARPERFAPAIARRIHTIFPQLGKPEIAEVWGGAAGHTVHGMPQIGQLRRGLWVTSGFGRQGLNTSAIAGQLIARSILWGDERWRMFSPFELVWAGGTTGRVAGYFIGMWNRGSSAAAGALARYRERARTQERIREARLSQVNRQAGTPPAPRRPPPGRPQPPRPSES